MNELIPDRIYLIELCSGERCRWQYLGPDARSAVWWRNLETGREFHESGVMYAWRVIGEADGGDAGP